MSESQDIIVCPGCKKKYRWNANLAGKKVRCKCGEVMRIAMAPPGKSQTFELAIELKPRSSGVNRDPLPTERAAPVVAAPAAGDATCPSCGAAIRTGAVICIQCGMNIQKGKKLETEVGRAVAKGVGADGQGMVYDSPPDGFFGRLRRSWEFIKISYGILWDFKRLLIFPIFSFIAALLVMASFILPLWGTDMFDQLMTLMDEERAAEQVDPLLYVFVFLFYFCSYFVIVFFNTALTACAMKVVDGQTPSVGYGLSIAVKRLPQIIAWALVSALVGVLLKAIENANEKVGRFIAFLIGSAWTVITYFVVPVLVVEGVGPIQAIKQSVGTMKKMWGEAVIGNFSLGLLSFLIAMPVFLVLGLLGSWAVISGSMLFLAVVIVVAVVSLIMLAALFSAADVVFKALLYNFATGRSVPAELDQSVLASAFAHRG